MGKSKLQIPKVCKYCGNTFLAKTVKTGYCSHHCAHLAGKEKKKKERRQFILDKIKTDGKKYITITDALRIFTTSRNTVHRLVRSKEIRCVKISPRRLFVCVQDLESIFPLKPEQPSIKNKSPFVFDLAPEHCYTIGEISIKFKVSEKSVYKHIRQYSIPIRQIGKFVYAPKTEIDRIYNNKNAKR